MPRILKLEKGSEKMKTLHDQFVAALVNLNRGQVVKQTKKYTVLLSLHRRPGGKPRYWYVGRAGAVRWGKNQSKSIAKSDLWKKNLLRLASDPSSIGI